MGAGGPQYEHTTFHWRDARAVLGELVRTESLALEDEGRWYASADGAVRVHPPLVVPIEDRWRTLDAWLDALPERLGRHLVVLLQAGASSLGWFDDEEEVETKSFRRYVVRGKGRAQPTHLATKGKSRYGSRLRLQNARALLAETNERMALWWKTYGPADRVYVGAPVRLFATLFDADPPPPFGRDEPVVRIPRDLPRPTTEVLRRAHRSLGYGRVERAR